MLPPTETQDFVTLVANNPRFDEVPWHTLLKTLPIRGISMLPQQIRPGWMYVAIDTPLFGGHDLISMALDRGAVLVVAQRGHPITPSPACPMITVDDTKRAYSELSSAFWGHAHTNMHLFSITGTKGKTTTCHVLASILRVSGFATGLICTGSSGCHKWIGETLGTTPEPFVLHGLLRRMRDDGVTHVVIEASSIGIAEARLHGLQFEGVGFTNLGSDHVRYHGDLARYGRAKAALFTAPSCGRGKRLSCAINSDDAFGRDLIRVASGEVITYGLDSGIYRPHDLAMDCQGISMTVAGTHIRSALIGAHNVYNLLCATALSCGVGITLNKIAEGISLVRSVPGRLEQVGDGSVAKVFVDYAHTAESVSAALTTIRSLYPDKPLIVVIGCGGGSDTTKRPAMARIALALSQICILTSDNSRGESTAQIIDDMLDGTDRPSLIAARRLEIIPDRRDAIFWGVQSAKLSGGVVAILGRGCEPFLVLNRTPQPFDDREVAYEALR